MPDAPKNRLEVYVRHNSNGAILNILADESMRERIVNSLSVGRVDGTDISICLELSVLPGWVTDLEIRKKIGGIQGPIHIRVPLSSINMLFEE